jgi:hypothetical protein
MLLDAALRTARELSIVEIPNSLLRDPVWLPGGREIAFVARKAQSAGGRIWIVAATGGQARPVTRRVRAGTGSHFHRGRPAAWRIFAARLDGPDAGLGTGDRQRRRRRLTYPIDKQLPMSQPRDPLGR